MPRVQLFDREKVLSEAMELFWKKGYNGTSTRDLEKATGLGTSSIYNSFGDKESLFFETLQYYLKEEQYKLSQNIKSSPSTLKALKALFEYMIQKNCKGEVNMMGCYLVNSITELANHHPRLNQFASEARTATIGLLNELIQKAQYQNEIPAEKDPMQLAIFLQTIMTGLKVSSMLANDPRELQWVLDLTLENLTKK